MIQEPPGRNSISVVFSLLNSNVPCHQPCSEFPHQVHTLAMSCHLSRGHTDLSLKEESRCLLQPELRHTLTGSPGWFSQGPGACCTPDFQHECGQRIWVWDPPALFSFCGFCLCSDPSAKEMLHCFRDVNLVAEPVSGQALPKLSSDLSRKKLNQKTEITGSGRELLCPFSQNPGKILH